MDRTDECHWHHLKAWLIWWNIRDYASINQLICLANMENLNAVFFHDGMPQHERLVKLNKIAIQQMTVLETSSGRKRLK